MERPLISLQPDTLKVFSGSRSRSLAEGVCAHMGVPLGLAEAVPFPDSEIIVKVNEDVRGRDCFVIISTSPPVNDNLMELLIYIDCLKRASAGQVIAVMPYFGYARQDRKNEGRTPITAKLIANLITAAGADRVVAVDLHAAQLQGFFDIPVDHLSASPIFLEHFEARREELGDLCFVSPDVGNVKVAEKMADLLDAELAIINKRRVSGSKVVQRNLIGDVSGKTVLMFDDMISTAGTVCTAAEFLMERGARRIIAAATHPVLCGEALDRLAAAPIEEVICANTIDRGADLDVQAKLGHKYRELSVDKLIGDAVLRIHNKRSVSELLTRTAGTKR